MPGFFKRLTLKHDAGQCPLNAQWAKALRSSLLAQPATQFSAFGIRHAGGVAKRHGFAQHGLCHHPSAARITLSRVSSVSPAGGLLNPL